MILYDYCRSSAAYRVRIALNLKALAYQQQSVNLLASAHTGAEHQARNTQKLVPVLADNGVELSQSMAICEYLDEAYPQSLQLVAGSSVERAKIRAFAQAIACEVHPVNNLRVLKYLVAELKASEEQKLAWYQYWVNTTFSALEEQLRNKAEQHRFACSNTPSLADVCLIPQIFNAKRFNVDMQAYPLLTAIDDECQKMTAFSDAHPAKQPDS